MSSGSTELQGFPAEHARATRDAPARIRVLDSLLTRAAAGSPGPAALDSAFRASIPDGGHALGHFLAAAIERELGAERLRATALNRFDFITAYQAAALRRPAAYPPFHEAAMAYFADLTRRYQATGR